MYQFWGNKIYQELIKDDHEILDLGAKQYSRIIKRYLDQDINYVKCYFMEKKNNTFKEVGVYVKQARGEMVRYLIKNRVTSFEQVKKFKGLGYCFDYEKSNQNNFIFVRKNNN